MRFQLGENCRNNDAYETSKEVFFKNARMGTMQCVIHFTRGYFMRHDEIEGLKQSTAENKSPEYHARSKKHKDSFLGEG